MVRSKEEIEALVVLYLRGEAMPEQAMEVENWRTLNEKNRALFLSIERAHGITHGKQNFEQPNVEKAWRKIEGQMEGTSEVVPLWKKRGFYYAAAAILLAFLVGGLWDKSTTTEMEFANSSSDKIITKHASTVILASDAVKSFTLKDQSKVELQPGSRLTIAEGFNQDSRRLKMEGSGTFEVIHDEDRPFIIDVKGLQVVDVGTIFSVNTIFDTVKVVVDEGAVELRLNGEMLDLVEGDSAFYVISNQVIERYKRPRERKKKIFEFDGTTLSEVVVVLSKFYGREIVVMDKEIENCLVSVTFKNEDLATILDIIKELLDVKVVQNKDIIGIYGKGCV